MTTKHWLLISVIWVFLMTSCLESKSNSSSTVRFVVPTNISCSVFLIHDIENGIEPEIIDGKKTYYFDEKGIIRIKDYNSYILKNTYIEVFNSNGEEMFIYKKGSQSGPNVMSVTQYLVALTKENLKDCLHNQSTSIVGKNLNKRLSE